MKLSKNFNLSEFIESKFYNEEQQVKVNESFSSDIELLKNVTKLAQNLQVLRDRLGVPITINIAYRPKWYELLMGRTGSSKHTLAMAGDIKAKGIRPREVHANIENLIKEGKMQDGGLGLYDTFVHYDVRNKKARW